MKTITAKELFTKDELAKATKLFHQCQGTGERFSTHCAKDIVEPIMERINKVTGQKNNQLYFAYLLEYLIRSESGWKSS